MSTKSIVNISNSNLSIKYERILTYDEKEKLAFNLIINNETKNIDLTMIDQIAELVIATRDSTKSINIILTQTVETVEQVITIATSSFSLNPSTGFGSSLDSLQIQNLLEEDIDIDVLIVGKQ